MGLGVVVVVGGCGHVGLPLGLLLAESGLMTIAYNIDERVVDRVRNENVPFEEPGAATALKTMLASGRFKVSTDPSVIADAETVIDVIGTPVDEHVNPDPHAVRAVVDDLSGQMRDGQLLVLSSTEATTSIEDILDEVLASPRPTRWATCCNASTASSPPAAGSPSSARTSATQSKAYFDCADRYVRER